MAEVYDTENRMIQLTMILRLQKIQREQFPNIAYDNFEEYLRDYLWKRRCPSSLQEAIDQVLHTDANDIIRYISQKVITEKPKHSLSDYIDLLGGK